MLQEIGTPRMMLDNRIGRVTTSSEIIPEVGR
jgi:hypothetical protein